MDEPLNYVRVHRRKSCLSQRELGDLVGNDAGQISKHERSCSLPTLLVAIGYSIVFRTSIPDIFTGLHESLAESIEERLSELEQTLRQCDGKDVRAALTARKLEWLRERRVRSNSLR
jgi:DNA-binding XRE family transcriptional regulator